MNVKNVFSRRRPIKHIKNDRLNLNFVTDEHTYGQKMARDGHLNAFMRHSFRNNYKVSYINPRTSYSCTLSLYKLHIFPISMGQKCYKNMSIISYGKISCIVHCDILLSKLSEMKLLKWNWWKPCHRQQQYKMGPKNCEFVFNNTEWP